MKRTILPTLFVLFLGGLLACANPQPSQTMVKTYGSLISSPPTTAWQATSAVFQELSGGRAQLNSNQRLARMTYQGAEVTVECVLHSSGGSVLRVGAQRKGQEARAVGDKVLQQIQRQLLGLL